MKNTPRKTYTEDQRILAVTILLENGGMTQLGLQLVREYLDSNVSLDTLHHWMNKYKDKVKKATNKLEEHRVEIIANNTKQDVVEVMEAIRSRLLQQVNDYVQHNTDTVDKTSLKNIMLSIAILQDKIEKATGMSAAMQAAIRPLAIACDERTISVYDVIEDMTSMILAMSNEQVEAYKNKRRLVANNNNP